MCEIEGSTKTFTQKIFSTLIFYDSVRFTENSGKNRKSPHAPPQAFLHCFCYFAIGLHIYPTMLFYRVLRFQVGVRKPRNAISF